MSEKTEIPAKVDNFKWVILKEDEAKKLNLGLVKIDEDKCALLVDLYKIPAEMTVVEYLDFIEDTGIVFNVGLKNK